MPFTVTARRFPEYVRFDVQGPASLKNYFDLIDDAARETLAHGDKRAMVDLRGVAGRLNFTDQFFIGDVVGKKLTHLVKLAVVVPDDPATYNSDRVANRNGVNQRSFADEEQAIGWLLAPDEDAPGR
jgi:hypothetical protein